MTNPSGESGHRAAVQLVVDAILNQRKRFAVNANNVADPRSLKWNDSYARSMVRERLENLLEDEPILPGFGENGNAENARDDCGNPHPFVCDSCGHAVDFGRTCGQSVCARCAVAWARDLSINKSAKLRRVRKEKNYHTPDSELQKFHHLVISPNLGWYYDLARSGHTLEEARQRGLLDDRDWAADTPHVDEAREADSEWPDDLDPWRTSSPGESIGAG